MRIGQFIIPYNFIQDYPNLFDSLCDHMTVLEVERFDEEESSLFTAMHHQFDDVPCGSRVPHYLVGFKGQSKLLVQRVG